MDFKGQDALSRSDSLTFAFEFKADTLSYMSCSELSNATYERRAIYTFRLGAYGDDAGLRLNDGFRKATQSLTVDQKIAALADSSQNKAALLQMAMRPERSYDQMVRAPGSAPNRDFDIADFLGPLDSPALGRRLAETADKGSGWTTYFSGTPGLGTRMVEQSLRFNQTEVIAEDLRKQAKGLTGRPALLAVTYTDGSSAGAHLPKSLAKDKYDFVYGLGYRMNFRVPANIGGSSQRVLDTVDEVDLSTGRTVKPWTCGSGNHYVVVRPQDVVPPGTSPGTSKRVCRTIVDPAPGSITDPNRKQKLNLIRSVLRHEDWFVDIDNNCVVPKTYLVQCYGSSEASTTTPTIINYTSSCASASTCPHFVSVCSRPKDL